MHLSNYKDMNTIIIHQLLMYTGTFRTTVYAAECLHCEFKSQKSGACRMEQKESRAGEDSSGSRISRIYTTSDVTNTMCLVFDKYSRKRVFK